MRDKRGGGVGGDEGVQKGELGGQQGLRGAARKGKVLAHSEGRCQETGTGPPSGRVVEGTVKFKEC